MRIDEDRRTVVMLLCVILLVFLLHACTKDTTAQIPPQEELQEVVLHTPPGSPGISVSFSDDPDEDDTELDTEEVVFEYTPDYYYSNHTDPDERQYLTILADPSQLIYGAPVFAVVYEPLMDIGDIRFAGFDQPMPYYGYDMRWCDLSEFDLSFITDLQLINFSTQTVWPDSLPEGFDPDIIVELGKNPGLGIRALHDAGITGEGVGIAIIDGALLLDHEQYRHNLMYYERIHCPAEHAEFHGSLVSSIAVGQDTGVAPDAKLYYIATQMGHFTRLGTFDFDAGIVADCIYRILEVNEYLPDNEKIRVISISRGYWKTDKNVWLLEEAIQAAESENIFVITASPEQYYTNFEWYWMDCDYLCDRDDPGSYRPATLLETSYIDRPGRYRNTVFFPAGSRTVACSTGVGEYMVVSQGSLSLVTPWCAGLYAMCCQADPDITPDRFVSLVYETALTTTLEYDGSAYEFGLIVNPIGIVSELMR